MSDAAFNQMDLTALEDVPKTLQITESPLIEQKDTAKKSTKLLNPIELTQAEETPALKEKLEDYRALLKHLEEFSTAIKLKARAEFDPDCKPSPVFDPDLRRFSQLITDFPIEQPILLFQQYEQAPNQWKIIPKSTFSGCKVSLEKWLTQYHQTHPITRANLSMPEKTIDEQATRYRYCSFNDVSQSDELMALASCIRTTMTQKKPGNPLFFANNNNQTNTYEGPSIQMT